MWDSCGKIVGPAATLKLVPVGEADESPVLGTLEAVKRGNPGDVLVIDQGGRTDVNSYGGVAGFLEQRGIECLVMEPASLHVNRRARRVKTDRIDVENILHTR